MNEKNLRVQTRGLSRPTSPGPSAQSSRRSSFSERQSPTESSHKPLKERTSSFTKNVQQRIAGMSSNNPSLGTSRSLVQTTCRMQQTEVDLYIHRFGLLSLQALLPFLSQPMLRKTASACSTRQAWSLWHQQLALQDLVFRLQALLQI